VLLSIAKLDTAYRRWTFDPRRSLSPMNQAKAVPSLLSFVDRLVRQSRSLTGQNDRASMLYNLHSTGFDVNQLPRLFCE
jgi:hypothetical protein